MNTLTPIKLLPARDRVAAGLREAILTRTIQPGEEMTLKDTAAKLGVSITPVREAFQILARDGLIELHPNRGAVVLGITEKRIRDHYETRAVLEREAAMAVCRRQADISPIRNAYLQAEIALKTHNVLQYSNYNQSFHMEIWNACGNDKIKEILSGLWNGLSMGHKVTQESYARISMDEHAGILQALESGDEAAAGARMNAHILRSMENVLTHLNTEP
ncbi:MAG: GntR family transcriptional regulator [Oscillospiraceae bacterium]|jgi:DNA-binding GntR family transcriptional regulator|nr:GntR family transcriptional regulator [Oscillospiraceae bacterium]